MTETTTRADDDYFGVCSDCGHSDGYLNIGRGHWFYCQQHKTRWFVGENLFSSWREQTKDEQRDIYDAMDFGSYQVVGPLAEDYYRFCAEREAAL